MGAQTDERQDVNMALKQLYMVTWVKSQLEWELLHKQCEQYAREDKLIVTDNR